MNERPVRPEGESVVYARHGRYRLGARQPRPKSVLELSSCLPSGILEALP